MKFNIDWPRQVRSSNFTFWCLVVACIALGAWLRLDQIAHQVLDGDEWHAIHRVTYYSLKANLLTFGNADFGIPVALYYALLAKLGGISELGMRVPMLLAGIGLILLVPWMLRGKLDDSVLLASAAFLALSPFLIHYSRIARTYAIVVFLLYLAYTCMAKALQDPQRSTLWICAYAVLSTIAAWSNPICGPFAIAPLAAAWLSRSIGLLPRARTPDSRECLEWRMLLFATMLTGCLMAAALLPPLLSDPAALAKKSGLDSITFETWVGLAHFWFGSGSQSVIIVGLGLAALGLRAVLRTSIEMRWIVLGTFLTVLALAATRPWWVDQPLALGRYLLPALPMILVATATGLILLLNAALKHRDGQASLRDTVLILVAVVGVWWTTSPLPEWTRYPNSYVHHSYFQLDYRKHANPVRAGLPAMPTSLAWGGIAKSPKRMVIAAAPFRWATWEWPAPLWEEVSGHRVIPGFLWGTCEPTRHGEVPRDKRFRLRSGVHLDSLDTLKERDVGMGGLLLLTGTARLQPTIAPLRSLVSPALRATGVRRLGNHGLACGHP